MPRARFAACLAALAAGCAVGAAGPLTTPPARAAARAPAITSSPAVRALLAGPAAVTVGGAARVAGLPTAQGFLGLATSYSTIPVLAGSPADPDLPFRALLRNLSPGAPFLLRLGGVSADDSWWPVPGMRKPRYMRTLTPQMARDVQALLSALDGGKAILGVNLEQRPAIDARIAQTEVAAFERYIGADRIAAFELGNEPEYWPMSVIDGGRGRDTIAAYGRQFSEIASGLGGVPVAGPASVGTVWLSELGTILRHLPAHLALVTVHAYPLKNCSSGARPLLSQLLSRASIQGLADSVHRMVLAAAAHAEPLRVDELNGITCGGKAGLSNSFGEALWVLNALPALWRAGVQGVNFQTVDGLLNQAITARHAASGWRVSVEPVIYGLLAFTRAAPAGSHLLRISSSGPADLYRFAVRAPDGSERVVLTNVGAAARTVRVTASGARGAGSVSLLTAASLSATGGTTLAGQSLSPRTGQLAGRAITTRARPNRRGVYTVRVPAHSAALLTLPR